MKCVQIHKAALWINLKSLLQVNKWKTTQIGHAHNFLIMCIPGCSRNNRSVCQAWIVPHYDAMPGCQLTPYPCRTNNVKLYLDHQFRHDRPRVDYQNLPTNLMSINSRSQDMFNKTIFCVNTVYRKL